MFGRKENLSPLIVSCGLLLLIVIAFFLSWFGWLLGAIEQCIAPALMLFSGWIWLGRKSFGARLPQLKEDHPAFGWVRSHLLPLSLFLSLLPLIAIWSGHLIQWSTMYAMLGGRIPWSDASGYYAGAASFLDEGGLNRWTSRRPINTLWLTARSAFTGERLEVTLIVQALMVGGAFFLSLREVWNRYGTAGALFYAGLTYGFLRVFTPSTLSEALGLTVGLLAVPLILPGIYKRSMLLFAGGCLVIGLGQEIRPGPIFILPALLLWAFFAFGPVLKRRLLVVALCIAAFAAPYLSNKACMSYAPEDAGAHSNFSYTFLGLTIGADWKGAEIALESPDFPYLEGESTTDAAYRVGIENIKQQPGVFVKTLAYNMVHSLLRVTAEVGNTLFSVVVKPWGITIPSLVIFGLLCMLLFLPFACELFSCLKQRNLDQGWFWSLALLAIIATFPIIIRDGSYRVLAGVYPLMLVFGAALLSPRKPAAAENPDTRARWATFAFAAIIMLGSFSLPLAAAAIHPPSIDYDVSDDSVTALRTEITGIRVVSKEESQSQSIARSFSDRTKIWEVEGFRHAADASQSELIDEIKELEAPFTLVIALEAKTGRRNYLVIPNAAAEFRSTTYSFQLGKSAGRWQWVDSFEPIDLED